MMFVAGTRLWPIIVMGIVSLAGFAVTLWMLPERRGRILAFLEPELHKEGKSYQIWQGMLAFASGGREGLGLGNSRQKMSYIPESTTDSILPIIGEELGLYVALAIILAYVLILIFGLRISLRSLDSFGLLLGFGLVFGICFQAAVNIATVTGSMPAKGMPLPFVSYGGSNLVISCVAMGFLVSIHRQSLRLRNQSQGLNIDEKTPHV
jgi:cell division protein FtsW